MNSVSEKRYSLEELKQLNMPPEHTPEAAPAAPESHPTAEEWEIMMSGLCELYRLADVQCSLLERLVQTQEDRPTWGQLDALTAEAKRLRALAEQAGREKEGRLSLPKLRLPELPEPSPAWLLVIPILVGLWGLWYSLGGLWNAVRSLLQLLQ